MIDYIQRAIQWWQAKAVFQLQQLILKLWLSEFHAFDYNDNDKVVKPWGHITVTTDSHVECLGPRQHQNNLNFSSTGNNVGDCIFSGRLFVLNSCVVAAAKAWSPMVATVACWYYGQQAPRLSRSEAACVGQCRRHTTDRLTGSQVLCHEDRGRQALIAWTRSTQTPITSVGCRGVVWHGHDDWHVSRICYACVLVVFVRSLKQYHCTIRHCIRNIRVT